MAKVKIEVYRIGSDRKPVKDKEFELESDQLGRAKREARAKLEAEGLYVRSIGRNAETGVLFAYVADKRPDARERGKPVVHTGPVGRDRQIRRGAKR